jgi:hypothetical protein
VADENDSRRLNFDAMALAYVICIFKRIHISLLIVLAFLRIRMGVNSDGWLAYCTLGFVCWSLVLDLTLFRKVEPEAFGHC